MIFTAAATVHVPCFQALGRGPQLAQSLCNRLSDEEMPVNLYTVIYVTRDYHGFIDRSDVQYVYANSPALAADSVEQQGDCRTVVGVVLGRIEMLRAIA